MKAKHTEAMKLALEALEYIEHNYMSLPAPAEKAITALREALASEAIEQPAPGSAHYEDGDVFERIAARKAQPAQQEPVAWLHTKIEGVAVPHRPADLDRHPDRWTPLYKDPAPCPTCEALARTVMLDQTSHDTSPTEQRTWVGLTDEEITDIWAEASPYYHEDDFARAIEAKLKQRNT